MLEECTTILHSQAGLLYLTTDLTGEPSQFYQWGISKSLAGLGEQPFWHSLMKGANLEALNDGPKSLVSGWVEPIADQNYLTVYSLASLAEDPDGAAIADFFTDTEVQSLLFIPLRSQYQWLGCLVLLRYQQQFMKRWAGRLA